ncbi:MAG: hypothetical protein RBT55_14320 [Rhodocyclaceae bacterium]|jgi:hypothetical protein|nr:hypothetical protein [Rhodocyclaceae bacterium]
MTTRWTPEQVVALSPDAASTKAGQKLAKPQQWLTLGQQGNLLWGELQGSGSNPYQTAIITDEPAFKCSCPSRKFPCKHGLGLAMIHAAQADALKSVEPPPWVREWLDKRSDRAQKKAEKAAAQDAPVDEATQAKRARAQQKRSAARSDKVQAGLEELQRWLFDLVRQGLMTNDPNAWQHMAARMVDAQAPGLARRLEEAGMLCYRGGAWQEAVLAEMARIHLLIEGWQRRAQLPPALADEIASRLGLPVSREEVLAGEGVADGWHVLAQAQEDDGQMRTRRTWLYGERCARMALLLDFSVHGQAMPLRPPVGHAFDGELVFYPGARPLRALIRSEPPPPARPRPVPEGVFLPLAEALAEWGRAIAHNPWPGRYPLALADVVPLRTGETWQLVDAASHCLPLQLSDEQGWGLLAASGGHPLALQGEWDGQRLLPLAAFEAGQAVWLAEVHAPG